VDDLAQLAVEGVYSKDSYIIDAVGPETFTFKEMVELIGRKVGVKRLLIPFPPRLALLAAQFLSLFVKDVLLTPEEVDGLMGNLLVSKEPPRCKTRLSNWLEENKDQVGAKYASELAKHYQ
jgi:NADH dehydrogenase